MGKPDSLSGLLAIAMLGVLVTAGCAAGLELGLQIKESLTGHVSWFTLDRGPPQVFSVRWDNIGSVNCNARPRIDFFSVDQSGDIGGLAYTSWGSKGPVMTGSGKEWELYSDLEKGEYAAVLRIYHCNEIFDQEPYFFTVEEESGTGGPGVLSVEAGTDYVNVLVGPGDNIAVVPVEYPDGWIIESGLAESGNIRLGLEPVGETGKIVLKAIDVDTGRASEREFSVNAAEQVNPVRFDIAIAIAILIIISLYVSKNIIKIWRR